MMIRSCLLFFLCGLSRLALFAVDGQNVAMMSSGSFAIATNGGRTGLLVLSMVNDGNDNNNNNNRQQFEIKDFGGGISVAFPFDDVSIDPSNENLVFALSTESLTVCSFVFGGLTEDDNNNNTQLLRLVGCAGVFSVSPFCGISAYGGTLVISGGTGGFTVYEYDQQNGLIAETPMLLNQQFPGIVIGHPDVVMVHANLVALSTDFNGGSSRFGTQMATIMDGSGSSSATATLGSDYRVRDTLGFDLNLPPSNFPLVNAIYRTSSSSTTTTKTILYTANGSMQIQDLALGGETTVVLPGLVAGFSAVTVSVHQARKMAIFGGVLDNGGGGSQILFYDLSDDPMNPTLVDSKQAGGDQPQRITSVSSGGDFVVFVTSESPGIVQFLDLPPPGARGDIAPTESDSSPPDDTTSSNETPVGLATKNSGGGLPALQMPLLWLAGSLVSGTVLAILQLY